MASSQDRNNPSTERLHGMLLAKSSSRIGRLNKSKQAVVIQQLVNEDMFTQDFHRKLKKLEGSINLDKTFVFKKQVKVEELI